MLDILPALLWIIAAVIAVNICSITAIRGNLFSKKHRDVHPVRWSIIALHFTSLVIGALPYPVYAMFRSDFSAKFPAFLRTCRMAVGCGDGHADRSGTCFHVSSGPKRHAQRDGAEAQSGRQIEI